MDVPTRAVSNSASVTSVATADHGAALDEGGRLATSSGRRAGSADMLLGLVRAGGAASRLLAERGVTAGRLEDFAAQVRAEPG